MRRKRDQTIQSSVGGWTVTEKFAREVRERERDGNIPLSATVEKHAGGEVTYPSQGYSHTK